MQDGNVDDFESWLRDDIPVRSTSRLTTDAILICVDAPESFNRNPVAMVILMSEPPNRMPAFLNSNRRPPILDNLKLVPAICRTSLVNSAPKWWVLYTVRTPFRKHTFPVKLGD